MSDDWNPVRPAAFTEACDNYQKMKEGGSAAELAVLAARCVTAAEDRHDKMAWYIAARHHLDSVPDDAIRSVEERLAEVAEAAKRGRG